MAKAQSVRKKIPEVLGECIPGDHVEIDGRRYYVAFTVPYFGHKEYWKSGPNTVFCGPIEESFPREGPYPFKPQTKVKVVKIYKDILDVRTEEEFSIFG